MTFQTNGNGSNLIKVMFQAHNSIGIDRKVDDVIATMNGDIEDGQQDKNSEAELFFVRKVFRVPEYNVGVRRMVDRAFHDLAANLPQGQYSLQFPDDLPEKVVVMVSKPLHLVWDLLGQWKYGSLNGKIDVVHIVSNHDRAKELANKYGVKFDNVARGANPNQVDWQAVTQILDEENPDWIDSARWMQEVPPDVIARNSPYSRPILNLHHGASGFAGQAPYQRVMKRGAKNTAAMGHFMVEEVDAGHIITEVSREIPSYVRTAADLEAFGAGVEQIAHMEMVRLKLDHRLWPYEFNDAAGKATRLCAKFY